MEEDRPRKEEKSRQEKTRAQERKAERALEQAMAIDRGAAEILAVLQSHGFEAFLVGGCVRDLCLGRVPEDWDIATSAQPEQVRQLFAQTIATGLKHGTVTVVLRKTDLDMGLNKMDKIEADEPKYALDEPKQEPDESKYALDESQYYEVTTYRIDGEYRDARRPAQVTFTASLTEDLRRRDFTINAMAYHPQTWLIDPFGGIADLQQKIIRVVGDGHERFREDALRMLRAVRFASQLGFTIAQETAQSIKANSHLLAKISKERIREELLKILCSAHPENIRQLSELSLMQYIIPEIEQGIGFDQRNCHHDKTVYEHTLAVVQNTPNEPVLRLAALLHDIAKPATFTLDEQGRGHFYGHHLVGEKMAREILERLKFDRLTIQKVCILVRNHMSRFAHFKDKGLKRFINRVGPENLTGLFVLQRADILASKPPHDFRGLLNLQAEVEKVLKEKQPLTVRDLAVNGDDLIALGMKPGKKLGETLQWLLEKVWENPALNTREKLLAEVKVRVK